MERRRAIRWVAALVLAAGLASPALASPRASKMDGALRLGSVWEAVVSWLTSGWSSVDGGTSNSEGDRGLMIDPDGSTSDSEGDRGSQMDPDG